MKLDCGGCAPPVYALSERQEEQRLVEQLRLENLAAAGDVGRPRLVENNHWGDGLIEQMDRDAEDMRSKRASEP